MPQQGVSQKFSPQQMKSGGKVEKEPKGLMVVIGLGKPKGPMKKAEGGKVAKVMHEFGEGKLHSGSKEGPKVQNPKQAMAIALSEASKAKKGYAEGGKAVKVPLPTEDEAPYPSQWPMPSDEQINKENWNQRKAIRRAMGAKNTGKDTFAKGGDVKSVPVKDIKSGKVKQSTDEDFYGKAKDAPMPPRRPSNMKKGGYAEGGSADKTAAFEDKVKTMTAKIKALKDKGLDVDKHFAEKATEDARKAYDKSLYGGGYAKGGKVHDDAAQDKAMIKSMIKPSALKKAMGGPSVQMAKSNAVEASMKGQKKTGYADGGMASPLQQMGRKDVPVAPRAPMIPQQAGANGPRIGVGRSRSGKPDVGAIRAAMARAVSQAVPENAPSMMKKGGKVGC
tara:strand:- start:993 stop:2165 length:1173 start_codon:yes stop_codon:yes gene_type:complete